MEHYHLTGIAGVGMSALAEVLLDQGHRVTGSDRFYDLRHDLPVLKTLQAQGVELAPQDGSALNAETAAICVSTAIEDDNTEILRAAELSVAVVHRARLLADLTNPNRLIAVAGTAGKTTTTAITGYLLAQSKLEPTVVNGGAVTSWVSEKRIGSVRKGTSDLWVLEADESDKSFLNFVPEASIITNISKDHFEMEETLALFENYVRQVKKFIVCGPGVSEQFIDSVSRTGLTIIRSAKEFQACDGGYAFNYLGREWFCPLPGEHNAENAACAVAATLELEADPVLLDEALRNFKGVSRRLEKTGEVNGIAVFDDYAHNPAKISAAIKTLKNSYNRLFCIWRPHGFGPLELMHYELTQALSEQLEKHDLFYVLPVFYVGGTAAGNYSSEDWMSELHDAGVPAHYTERFEDFKKRVLLEAQAGDAVLIMGARDPELPVFARSLISGE